MSNTKFITEAIAKGIADAQDVPIGKDDKLIGKFAQFEIIIQVGDYGKDYCEYEFYLKTLYALALDKGLYPTKIENKFIEREAEDGTTFHDMCRVTCTLLDAKFQRIVMDNNEDDDLFDKHHFVSDGFDCYTGWLKSAPSMGDFGCAYPCGYIALPKGHQFHGKPYQEISEYTEDLMCAGLADEDAGTAFCSSSYVRLNGSWFIGFDIGFAGEAGTKSDVIQKIKRITEVMKEYM